MSKAFIKEDSEIEEETDSSAVEDTGINYITPTGAKALRAELRQLQDTDRPEVVKIVSWAASNGDRSENGDYIYGKRRLREIDKRIRFISKRLEKAQIIDPKTINSIQIQFGATVTILNSDGREIIFKIVGVDETNIQQGKISWKSPIGNALLRSSAGDLVTYLTPRGEEEIEILKVTYEEIT